MDEKDKKVYELAVLVPAEDDLAGVVALIRQHNGEMASEPRAKKLALAYEIKKHTDAVFAYCTFTAATSDAKNLEKDLNTKAEVLQFMILASPPPAEERQPMMPMAPGAPVRRTRTMRPSAPSSDAKPAAPKPLSNEALEKKIEEILQ